MQLYEPNELIDLVNKKTNEIDFTGTINESIKFIRLSRITTERSVRVMISQARDIGNRSAYGYRVRATKPANYLLNNYE